MKRGTESVCLRNVQKVREWCEGGSYAGKQSGGGGERGGDGWWFTFNSPHLTPSPKGARE